MLEAMKTENVKSIAIGFLLAACLFLFTGQADQQPQAPVYRPYRYQLHKWNGRDKEILVCFDAETGTTKFVAGSGEYYVFWGMDFNAIPNGPVITDDSIAFHKQHDAQTRKNIEAAQEAEAAKMKKR